MDKFFKALALSTALTLGACEKKGDEDNTKEKDRDEVASDDNVEEKETVVLSDSLRVTLEAEEKVLQENYLEDYGNEYGILYGERLYTNSELLDNSFLENGKLLEPNVKFFQFFLRNGKDLSLQYAHKLGCIHHETVLDQEHEITKLFKDAGIDIEGEAIDWVEVPEGRSGSLNREGERYGGKTELLMTVEQGNAGDKEWIIDPARKAGYDVDSLMMLKGVVANEMSHEIQEKYFHELFFTGDWEKLTAPFQSFTTEVPGLRFQNNAQAAEFLSDVADWTTNSENAYYRFFNPLYYMSETAQFSRGKEDRYWYSYQVQQYAMEKVLTEKGYDYPQKIVQELMDEANKSDYKTHDQLFVLAAKYFEQEDFVKIAEVYRRIGVEVLKTMQPYFQGENANNDAEPR